MDSYAKEINFKPKSNFTPYLLLIALSIHGLFEGIALGVQEDFRDIFFLLLAILAHKWAESLTLVKYYYLF
jgi:zinc transporter 1/2/3